MIIPLHLLQATARRTEKLGKTLLKHRPFDFLPSVKRDLSPERLARSAGFLALGGTRASDTEFERMMGTNDLVDEFFLVRGLLCARPVARLSIGNPTGGERGCATGFMVSPRLLLTNHHVFGTADEAAPSIAEFNYRDDVAGNPEPSYRHRLRPDLFFFTSEKMDFTLVSVEPEPLKDGPPLSTWGWLRLIAESGKAAQKDWLSIIQHPGGERRQFALRENQCVDDKDPDYLLYLSDTAPGSSGAPVFNDSFQVAALHHSGRARQENGKYILRNGQRVDSLQGVDDSLIDWIANEGVRVSRICAVVASEAHESNGHLQELRAAMQGGDVLDSAFQNPTSAESMNSLSLIPMTPSAGSAATITVPVILDLRLSLFGQPLAPGVGALRQAAVSNAPTVPLDGGDAQEAYKQPFVDSDYTDREGFNKDFLGIATPLPTLVDPSVAAKLKGSTKVIIPYHHFSIVMHKTRRLAIYTASNVDWSLKGRRPEQGKDYTRAGLAGLSKSDTEQWRNDPRLDDNFQTPDVFYQKDAQSFDKGHIVRRDDMCWGATYAEVQNANGDTYHVTNCSPQIAGFNRSASRGDWGLLENFVQAQGKTEKYNVFSGPVLADGDRTFAGNGSDGALTLKIPSKFWKVVVAVKGTKLQAFGFVLEQDLSQVPPGVEFQPTDEWRSKMMSLKDLEALVKLIKFPKALHDADQA